MKNQVIKKVVATGIGAALFVVIGILINIPTAVPNTSIQLQYGVQALFAVIFGPVVGFFSGFIGHALKDALQSGTPWWTWVIGSGLLGLVIGLIGKKLQVEKGKFGVKDFFIFNLVQVVANVLVWGFLAPYGDVLVYAEDKTKVYAQGLMSASVNAITVGVAGTLLLIAYAKTRTSSGSLSKD